MIEFRTPSNQKPHILFREAYNKAMSANQNSVEAIVISSYSKELDMPDSRYVNLKIVDKENYIFFSNYESQKSAQFQSNNKISALIYWNNIDMQIRMKAIVSKTSKEFNNSYFAKRSKRKNALAISSKQSKKIDSYAEVIKNYNSVLNYKNQNIFDSCPDYWGGFSFTPYYFEFWYGHESRINKRQIFELKENKWLDYILQP